MGFLDKAKQAAQNAQKEGGLMDKAKQAAKQAQEKLDETQKNFNEKQAGNVPAQGPAVEYDAHGRPISSDAPPPAEAPVEPAATGAPPAQPTDAPAPAAEAPTTEAPTADAEPAPPAGAQPPAADAPTTEAPAPPAPPPSAAPGGDGEGDEYEPPKMTSGDPLAG